MSETQKKKIEIKIIELKNNLDVLNAGKDELGNILKIKNEELKNINQRIIDIEKYGEINPFDFSDNQQDNEIDLGEFLDIVESNIVNFGNDEIQLIFDNIKDGYPLTIKGQIRINNNDPSMINAFFKNRDELNQRIDKINEICDESVTITFTGILIKYTKIIHKIRRSYFGTGCDSFKKIVEYRGNLCYIPEENECFRKCLEFIYKKDFSEQYREFIQDSRGNKNIMTSARIQPFCKIHKINLGNYNINQQEILPRSVTERRLCLYIHENHFCVIWKTNKSTFTDAIKKLKDNFKHETNQISDNILKQVQEYKFPISNDKDCIYCVFF